MQLKLCFLVFAFSYLAADEVSQKTHRVFQFENEHVKVWKTVIAPDEPLNFHRHDCSRIVVTLRGGTLTRVEETGETSELVFENEKAYWLTEDPPETLHADINSSGEPIEVMVIEVKPVIAP